MTDRTKPMNAERLEEIEARVEAATQPGHTTAMDLRGQRNQFRDDVSYLLDLVASLTKERDAEKAAMRKWTDAMDQAVTFLGTVNDAMYECVFCGATKDEEHHRPGCQVDAALATMKARTYSVTTELADLRAVVEEARATIARMSFGEQDYSFATINAILDRGLKGAGDDSMH